MKRIAAALALTTSLAGPLAAQSQGDWNLGIGVGNVNPKPSNGTLAGGAATISDIGYAGTVKQLPPTLSLPYHFPTHTA